MGKSNRLIHIPRFSGTGELFDVDLFIEIVEAAYGNPKNLSPEKLDTDKTRMMILISHTTGEALRHMQILGPSGRTSGAQLTGEMRKRWIREPLSSSNPEPRIEPYMTPVVLEQNGRRLEEYIADAKCKRGFSNYAVDHCAYFVGGLDDSMVRSIWKEICKTKGYDFEEMARRALGISGRRPTAQTEYS
jgi:hypothetical protein